MDWNNDDIMPRARREVGRPVGNPFPSTESEEDFSLRGKAMLNRFFVPEGISSKKSFDFGRGRQMSKSLFWGIIYVYYLENHGLEKNLNGFLQRVRHHFGERVMVDRISIHKTVCLLYELNAHHVHTLMKDEAGCRQQQKYRMFYQFIVSLWKRILDI